MELSRISEITKSKDFRPTLVPTGIKCELPSDYYLELSVRSSCPLKHWLILANGVGIIDADYYNNPDNEGHIYFQKYYITDDDKAEGSRVGGFGSTNQA